MNKKNEIKIVEEKGYLARVDAMASSTNSLYPQVYWRVLKKRLKEQGKTVTNCKITAKVFHRPDTCLYGGYYPGIHACRQGNPLHNIRWSTSYSF